MDPKKASVFIEMNKVSEEDFKVTDDIANHLSNNNKYYSQNYFKNLKLISQIDNLKFE